MRAPTLHGVLVAALVCGVVPEARAQRIRRAEDRTPPTIRVIAPAPGTRVESFTPTIEVTYDDGPGSGVAVVSFRATINDRDYSGTFEHDSRGAIGKISAANPLPLGENRVTIEVADRLGNVGRAETSFVNAGGGWLSVTAAAGVGPGRQVELVLDASGSMSDKMFDNTRMAVAKSAVKALVKGLPETTPLGLRVFRDCDEIASLLPIAKVNKATFTATVDKIEPRGGTPIVASLLQSFQALAKFSDAERIAVLVTDGQESCSGSFAEAATQAKELSIRVIVISFDIKDQVINEQLRKLAEMTGGAYFNAQDGAELQAALERSILRLGFGVYDAAGARIADGEVNGDRVMLPIGNYEMRLDVSSARVAHPVTIPPLGEVRVSLRQAGTVVVAELAGGKS